MKTFDKSEALFPVKTKLNFLSYCSVSPMYGPAATTGAEFLRRQSEDGLSMFFNYYKDEKNMLPKFHKLFAELFKTSPENITCTGNTAQGLNMIANGYPFEAGDEIISYVHEYPANHYPWKLQESRGVTLKLLKDFDPIGGISEKFARGWSFEELTKLVTKKTRIIAISHVQFTSGYKADLKKLGAFCKDKNIDLVVDAAQSLGSVPVYPEEYGVSAIASAGWKWLLGPLGIGVMYTSKEFRSKIKITQGGADNMIQGANYLDHTWNPFEDGRKFEYSTLPAPGIESLINCLEEIFTVHSPEEIQAEIFRLQDLVLSGINRDLFMPLEFSTENRSGILSVIPLKRPGTEISAELLKKGILLSERSGYLRFAPHFCSKDDEILSAVECINSL